jgi:tetratricopeptide (TPR) repeat protein
MRLAAFIGIALALVALPVSAQNRDQNIRLCTGAEGVDAQIAGCTALIQSGREDPGVLAVEYRQRGDAYMEKGLEDQAIPDYTHAIALEHDPKLLAVLYFNRGVAHENKGERDLAVADYRAALKLAPNFHRPLDGLKRLGAAP